LGITEAADERGLLRSGEARRCRVCDEEDRESEPEEESMCAWKNRLVVLTMIFLGVSFLIFLVTGYAALYWAWARANLETARPYLPWARNSGMLAMAGAAVALGILFSSKTFPLPPKTRLLLSLLATITIGFFAEFRNEGKFEVVVLFGMLSLVAQLVYWSRIVRGLNQEHA
jgi:hypothetical protein